MQHTTRWLMRYRLDDRLVRCTVIHMHNAAPSGALGQAVSEMVRQHWEEAGSLAHVVGHAVWSTQQCSLINTTVGLVRGIVKSDWCVIMCCITHAVHSVSRVRAVGHPPSASLQVAVLLQRSSAGGEGAELAACSIVMLQRDGTHGAGIGET